MSGPYPPSDSFVIITILSKPLDILPKIFQKIINKSLMNEIVGGIKLKVGQLINKVV